MKIGVGPRFRPTGDDVTMHGGIIGEPRMMTGRDLSFLGHTDFVERQPKRGLSISQQPTAALNI